ncbi:MAG: oligosaccharide flippase family protein [Candidatus Neomarinimicrobiota bacterium]
MTSQIRRLARQTFVYGAGNVLTRLITFLLLPLYTHVLSPREYGLATLVYVFLGFMNIIYHYGLDAAFMKRYSDAKENEEQRRLFSTAVWLSAGTSGVLSLLILSVSRSLASAVLVDSGYGHLFRLAAGILFLDALAHVPFAFLRIREKAGAFISIKLINVFTTLGLNIYLVAILHRGITGIFISVFVASVVTTLSVFVLSIFSLRPTFSSPVAKAYLKFGLPFMPAGLASIAMEMIDRYILAHLKDSATVGIYSAGYKLGIFMLLLTTAFHYAWQPFFLKMGKGEQSRPLFAKVFSYFILASTFVWILLSAFIHEIVRLRVAGYSIIGPSFYEAEAIVPLILLAYIFQGAYLNFLPGIYFEKKTFYIPIITGGGAVINVGLNFVLIPPFGMMGAAAATIAGYFAMSIITFFVAKRLYPVPYEWRKIVRIALPAGASMAVILFLGESIPFKLIGISIFIIGILAFRVVSTDERKKVLFFSTFTTPFIEIDRRIMQEIAEVRSVTAKRFTAIARIKWSILSSHVVVAWFASTYSALAVSLARLFRKKSIVIVGGADVVVDRGLGYGMVTSRWKERFVKYSLRNATYVLPTSKYLMESARMMGDYDGGNMRLVSPGLDSNIWVAAGKKERLILTVAACPTEKRLRIKGIDILIDAARLVPEAEFLVVGVEKRILELLPGEIPPNVTTMPFLGEGELLEYYQRAQVYCQPSRIESFSFSLAQGMLCECIPVGTHIGGIPEVMGKSGFLVPPENSESLASALKKALKANTRMGEAARSHVQREFSLQRRSKELEQLIKE